jgi:predicted nucleic acid-binding protein
MLTGVLDTNVIIGLTHGYVFDLLPGVYTSLFVPPAVTAEVIGQGRPGEAELRRALGVWIMEVAPDPPLVALFSPTLSLADRQVLALAQAHTVDHVLSADAHLCREATAYGLTCLHASDLVVLLKHQGAVPAVQPVLDRMRLQGFGIDDRRYEQALRAAGEWPTP